MRYLLDTNVCIGIMYDTNPAIRFAYNDALLSGHALLLSPVTVFELAYGSAKSKQPFAAQGRLHDFLENRFAILAWDEHDATSAALIRANLESRKQPMGPFDTLIAGQALARNLTLVTANVREFARVEGLRWQDWGAPA